MSETLQEPAPQPAPTGFWKSLPIVARGDRSLFTLQVLSILAMVFAYVFPVGSLGFSICLFQNTTGLPCPGCGLTRSVSATLHLNFTDAYYFHPAGVFIAACIVFFVATAFIRPLADLFLRLRPKLTWVAFTLVILVFAFGALRLYLIFFQPDALGDFGRVLLERNALLVVGEWLQGLGD